MEENNQNESVILHLKKKIITLRSEGLDSEVNVDELLTVDYSNLFGESVTISVLLNKIGELKAEAQAIYERKKLEFEIFEADRAKNIRQNAKSAEEKLTEKSLEERIVCDPAYKIQKSNLINAQKDLNYIESLYVAVRSKDQKLNILARNIIPEEHCNEIIEQKINTVMIKIKNKIFKES